MSEERGFSFFRTLYRSVLFLLRHFHEFLLTAIPLLVIYAATCVAAGYPLTGRAEFGFSFLPMHQILPGIIGWVLVAILAVRWHRRVLIGPFDGWTAYVPLLGRREVKFLFVEILVLIQMVILLMPLGWIFALIGSAAIQDYGAQMNLEVFLTILGAGGAALNILVTFAIASIFLVFPMIAIDRPASWTAAASLTEGCGIRVRLLLAISAISLSTGFLLSSLRVDVRGGGGIRFRFFSGGAEETLLDVLLSYSGDLIAAAFCATVFSLTYRCLSEIRSGQGPGPAAVPA